MTFKKLTEQDKKLLEDYKNLHGGTNLSSYRALLMRGTEPKKAMEIISSRSNIKPDNIEQKPKTNARKPREAVKEPEPVQMDVDSVKEPQKKTRTTKVTKVKKENLKKPVNDNTIDLVI
jgi:hypothetical protein|tara:strand:+ start:164 stop:520 length:357 start_codon:yes stop_codon:yes gene_type:complete